MLRENESLTKANDRLNREKDKLQRNKDSADNQISGLTKSLEVLQKDLKERENQVTLYYYSASFGCCINSYMRSTDIYISIIIFKFSDARVEAVLGASEEGT